MLGKWILRGELYDPHNEFFIKDRLVGISPTPFASAYTSKSRSVAHISSISLLSSSISSSSERWVVVPSLLPPFLPLTLCEQVLKLGRRAMVLRCIQDLKRTGGARELTSMSLPYHDPYTLAHYLGEEVQEEEDESYEEESWDSSSSDSKVVFSGLAVGDEEEKNEMSSIDHLENEFERLFEWERKEEEIRRIEEARQEHKRLEEERLRLRREEVRASWGYYQKLFEKDDFDSGDSIDVENEDWGVKSPLITKRIESIVSLLPPPLFSHVYHPPSSSRISSFVDVAIRIINKDIWTELMGERQQQIKGEEGEEEEEENDKSLLINSLVKDGERIPKLGHQRSGLSIIVSGVEGESANLMRHPSSSYLSPSFRGPCLASVSSMRPIASLSPSSPLLSFLCGMFDLVLMVRGDLWGSWIDKCLNTHEYGSFETPSTSIKQTQPNSTSSSSSSLSLPQFSPLSPSAPSLLSLTFLLSSVLSFLSSFGSIPSHTLSVCKCCKLVWVEPEYEIIQSANSIEGSKQR
ncbi:hypothetical protein ADUPG1_007863, partial [Aduncisulcus paluster]